MLTIKNQLSPISHLLEYRELGKRVPLENFKDQRLIQNMREGNYSKNIFNGHNDSIIALDVQGLFAATLSFDDTIKLWDLETGRKCLWTFNPNPKVRWR